MNLFDQRNDYKKRVLSFSDLDPNPFIHFLNWLTEAKKAKIIEPNAMILSTSNERNELFSRVVLLKQVKTQESNQGFVFFTNYRSDKAKHLSKNPNASLCFFWNILERQVCISGVAKKVSDEENKRYFMKRPRKSQVSAWASEQSKIIPKDRSLLEDQFKETESEFEDQEIPVPPFWGGYCLEPSVVSFWQGRSSRLHDRFQYKKNESGNWEINRIAP